MTTEVATPQTFEEKLMERMRDSIGELMTDQDLRQIVDRGIDQVFFKERKTHTGHGYSQRTEVHPPLITEFLTKAISDQIEQQVAKWAAENSELIEQKVVELIEQGAGDMLLATINRHFSDSLLIFGNSIKEKLRQMSIQNNLVIDNL